MDPADRAPYEESLAAVRAGLDEQGFRIAWERGQGRTVEEAAVFALAVDEVRNST